MTTPRSTHFIRAALIGEILLGMTLGFAMVGALIFAAMK